MIPGGEYSRPTGAFPLNDTVNQASRVGAGPKSDLRTGSQRNLPSLEDQETAPGQRRVVAVWCITYVLVMVAMLPFAADRIAAVPTFTGIYATAVFIVDMCTWVLLSAQFLSSRRPWLLLLASAYLFSAGMAVLHLLTFPGAIVPESPLIGPPQTVAWLYIFWALGYIALLFAAVLWHAYGGTRLRAGRAADEILIWSAAGVVGVTGLLYVVASSGGLPSVMDGNRFSSLNIGLTICRCILGVAALVVLWRTSDHRTNVLHLWLSLALVAAIVGPLLGILGQQRYTVGWYAGRVSFAFASAVLLCVMLAEFVRLQHALALSVRELQAKSDLLEAESNRREVAERQLRHTQKMEAIGRMAGGVAHDFNNLLGAVLSFLELILRTSTEERTLTLADRAKQVSLRGGRLTRSLLAFAQRQPLRAELVQTDELLKRFEVLMSKALGESVTLRIDASAATWPVHIDPEQLEIALLNLALNSRDAMPAGGEIHIHSKNVTDPAVNLSLHDVSVLAGDYVEVSVFDEGCGIPDHQIDKVFDPFFTTKEVGKGTGLGLSQVRGFMRQSGGEAVARNIPGGGTAVSMYLPRASSLPSETTPSKAAGNDVLSKAQAIPGG